MRTALRYLISCFAASFCAGFATAEEASSPAVPLVQWAWSAADIQKLDGWCWPQYRGLNGDGLADSTAQPPEAWGENQNLLWKRPLDGRAWSSPVVWGDQVWLTNADADGKWQSLVGLDRKTGEIVRNQILFTNDEVQADYHVTNSYASSTPVIDGSIIFCHFGAYGTAAVDLSKPLEQSIVWQRRDLKCNHYRGAGSSPILFQDSLIMHFDGYDLNYVVALDKLTGETIWKYDRDIDFQTDNGDMHKAFSTPQVINANGRVQLISPAANAVESLDPSTGKRLWFVTYEEHSSASRPLFDGKTVFLNTGFSKSKLIAIHPAGKDDITATNVKWEVAKGIGSKPSIVMTNNRLFSVEDRGVLSCIDPQTGEFIWQTRLGGDFSSSPIAANGYVYLFDEVGKGYAIAADSDGSNPQENKLDAGCMASPAICRNCLFVRTTQAVYCFQAK